jgi:hypothetical protein
MFFTGFMCLLYLLTLVLAALSFHIYPNAVYVALAYHIVLVSTAEANMTTTILIQFS